MTHCSVTLAIVLMAAAVGCSDVDAPSDDARAGEASIVDIRTTGCGPRARNGVGTAIDDGLVVTAAHVVAGSDAIEITMSDGSNADARIVYIDADLDVAALRTDADVGDPVALRLAPVTAGTDGSVALPVRGDRAATVVAVEIVRPVNIRTTDIHLDGDVERHGLEVTATVEPGDSGAMVMVDGLGAGIIWARSTIAADRAWTVDVPDILRDPARRDALTNEVNSGECPAG